jgi:hypothetical protein
MFDHVDGHIVLGAPYRQRLAGIDAKIIELRCFALRRELGARESIGE